MENNLTNRISEARGRAERLHDQTSQEFWDLVVECSSILKEIHPNQRKAWLEDVKSDLYQSQNGLCALCDLELEEISSHVDHIIPFTYGGGNEHHNIQLAHAKCNRQKGADVDVWDLLRYLESRYSNI
jgi:5-methylcytosine-specific restriction endonuclease McrA